MQVLTSKASIEHGKPKQKRLMIGGWVEGCDEIFSTGRKAQEADCDRSKAAEELG